MMKKLCSRILLFCLIFVSALKYFAASANEESRIGHKDLITNVMKINEKFDFLSQRVDELEENSKTESIAADVDKIKANVEHILAKQDKFEKLLLELLKRSDPKINKRESNVDILHEINSQCTLLCQSKVNVWANETTNKFKGNLEKVDFCINNSTFKGDNVNSCDSNPCFNGGQCEPISYHCVKCPYPTSGRHCENLNCNKANRCFQYQNSMYVVFERNVSWVGAYNRCLSEGMLLAMPKDKDSTEFIINQLRSIYGLTNYYWIGLQNNGTAEYRWIDGTPLGDYTGGLGTFKSLAGERWGILWLDGKTLYWYPRISTEMHYGPHYTLCEKRILIRF